MSGLSWQPYTDAELATELVSALRKVETVLADAYGHHSDESGHPPMGNALGGRTATEDRVGAYAQLSEVAWEYLEGGQAATSGALSS